MRVMPPGPYPVEVGLCLSSSEWRREMRQRGVMVKNYPFPKEIGCCTEIEVEGGLLVVVSFTEQLCTYSLPFRAGIVVHEAAHVWQNILAHCNELKPGHEVEALSIEWITRWLLEQLEEEGWLQ